MWKCRAHAQYGGNQIHLLALYTRLSPLLRTLFSGWLHCRNARSTAKLTKMIDFEVSWHSYFSNIWHVGMASAIGPVARKPLLGGFVAGSLFIHNSQPLLELSSGRETWLTRQTSATTTVHAHGTLLTTMLQDVMRVRGVCALRSSSYIMASSGVINHTLW